MRDIKFRIFNKTIGYFVQDLDSDKASLHLVDLAHYLSSNNIENTSGYVFPQFTGLLDKNGKEIYEGDIIVQHYKDGTATSKMEVFWAKSAGGWWAIENGDLGQELYMYPNCEIVGNIFENPHLLK